AMGEVAVVERAIAVIEVERLVGRDGLAESARQREEREREQQSADRQEAASRAHRTRLAARRRSTSPSSAVPCEIASAAASTSPPSIENTKRRSPARGRASTRNVWSRASSETSASTQVPR